jgi:hypothetical protein
MKAIKRNHLKSKATTTFGQKGNGGCFYKRVGTEDARVYLIGEI